jgi:hypothetical protein
MPYRAPGTDDDRLKWILREIQKSQQTLDESIAAAERLPDHDLSKTQRLARYRELKREVDKSFFGLDKSVSTWADRDVRSFYQTGWFAGAAQVNGASFDFTLPHREALDIISFDAYDDVATRLQGVRQGFTDTIDLQELYEGLSIEEIAALQARTRSSVAQALLTGEADPKKVARSLTKDIWEDNPKLQIIDGGGNHWQMQNYTRMLVRTKSANAYNSGTLNKYAEEGVRRVKVFDGVEDDECAKANGETWSLRYAMNHPIAHPNCVRAFAAVSGTGDVNRDTETKGLVLFDRAELGIGALAALRYFNRTGEVNISSTLARLAWELVEVGTFPMPLVDEFITGLAHLGLREVDGWIESYIDPVLYAAGLIQKIPNRATLRAMNRPEQVLDAIAKAMVEANQAAFGTDYHPAVRRVVDNLARVGALIESGVWAIKAETTNHVGGLKWIGPLVTQVVDMNHLGQLTAETFLRVRDGEQFTDAFRSADFLLNQFKDVKRLHLAASNSTHDELVEIFRDLDRISRTAALLLGDEIKLAEAPEAFVDFLQRYGLSTSDLSDETFVRRRLAELLNDVRRTQRQVLHQIETFEGVPRQRQLAMAVSSGKDIPAHASALYDPDNYTAAADTLAGNMVKSAPMFNTILFRDYVDFFRQVRNHPESEMYQLILDTLDPERLKFTLTAQKYNPAVASYLTELTDDPASYFDAFVNLLNGLFQDQNGVYRLAVRGKNSGAEIVDEIVGGWMEDVLKWISPVKVFVDSPEVWAKFIDDNTVPSLITRRLASVYGSDVNPVIVAIGYRDLVDDLAQGAAGSGSVVGYTNLDRWLVSLYGEANVEFLSTAGVNGQTYSVWDEVAGTQLFIKKLASTAGHTHPEDATLSYIMTNWMAEQLGTVSVPPVRVMSLNPDEAIAVLPYIDDAVPWFHLDPYTEIEYISARRVYFFDLVSGESDNHLGNVMMDAFDDSGEIIIDREMSFGFYTGGNRFDADQKDGPMYILADKLGEEWFVGDDVVSTIDRPVRLGNITQAEFETYAGMPAFDPVRKDPYGGLTNVIFDVDGHNFPLVLRESAGPRLELTGDPKDIMDVAIPYGRVGWYQQLGHQQYAPSITPTDSELALVQKILNQPRQELHDELVAYIEAALGDVSDDSLIKAKIGEIWGVAEFPSDVEGVGGAVDYALNFLKLRVSRYVDGGVINTSGTKTRHVNTNGDVFTIGEAMSLTDIDGNVRVGTVFNIAEDTQGNTRVHWLEGVGHKLDINDMPAVGRVDVLDPEQHIVYRKPALELKDMADLADEVSEKITHVSQVDVVDLTPLRRETVKLDAIGLPVGIEESTVVVEYVGSVDDAVRIVDDAEHITSLRAQKIAEQSALPYIEAELSRIPAQFRPRSVKVHLNMLETTDGKPAFGYFDPETKDLHVTLAEIFDLPVEDVRGVSAFRLPAGQHSYEAFDDLDWDPFVRLLRHEIGHSVGETMLDAQRTVILTDVARKLSDEFPDVVTRGDLNQLALDLVPQDINLAKYEDAFDALVQTRADLIEDVIHTNRVVEASHLLDDSENVPEWISRAYAGVQRGDTDAVDEFVADVFARVSTRMADDATEFRQATRDVADELGIDKSAVTRLFNPVVDELPPTFDITSIDFQLWLSEALDPRAQKIIPKERSGVRVLWKRINIDVERVVREQADGFTLDLDGVAPTTGYSVALRQFEEIIPAGDDPSEEVLNAFLVKHRKLLEENPELRYGGWLDDKGDFYLDIVRLFDDRIDAANYGFIEHQKAMFGFDALEEIPLMDDAPDFTTWMSRHYPDDPFEEYLAKERRVGAVRTKRTVDTKEVLEVLADEEGDYFPISLEAFNDVQQKKLIDSLDAYYKEATDAEIEALESLTVGKLREEARQLGIKGYSKMKKAALVQEIAIKAANPEKLTPELIKKRLIHVLDTFEEHNTTSPPERLINLSDGREFQDLRGKYRFYTHWRDEFVDVSLETGVPAPAIIAGAARMSAGLDADANLWIARFMAQMVAENGGTGHVLTRAEAKAVREFLGTSLEDKGGQAYRYLHKFDKPERADGFVAMSKIVKANRSVNQYDPVTGAYIMHVLTILNSKGLGRTGKGYSFATQYGYPQFQIALQSMQGRLSIEQVLGDSKVRSFYNNIIDPENIAGIGDVTVDFHMTDMALDGIGAAGKGKYKGDEPRILGVGAGLRPIIGDTVRELFDEGWGARVGAATPAELQEILWGMWRDGKEWGLWGDLRRINKR